MSFENNIDYTKIDIKIDVKRKIRKEQINKMSKNSYELMYISYPLNTPKSPQNHLKG